VTQRLFFVLLLISPLFAQSRFNGNWEMKMDTLEFSGTPEEYVLDKGIYHCLTCVPKVDVATDGNDHKVAGHPLYDTIAVRIVDDRSVKFTMKKAGKPTFNCVETVSSDGQTMVEEFTNAMEAATVSGEARFTRVSGGPSGPTRSLESGECRRSGTTGRPAR